MEQGCSLRIETLLLINYRNYEYQKISFHKGINVLIGDNAQGKTNLLESVYLCARGGAFKNAKDSDIIKFGERSGYVRASIDRNEKEKIVEVKLSQVDRKRIRINEVELENLKELTNQFDVVLFSPEDLRIVKDGPIYRRRYLDDVLTAIAPEMKRALTAYQHVLLQRNNLLKRARQSYFKEQIEALDQQLAKAGANIVAWRTQLVAEIDERARIRHTDLSNAKEYLHVKYQTNAVDDSVLEEIPSDGNLAAASEKIEKEMRRKLEASLDRDIEYKNTDIGPHKDDLEIEIDGMPAKRFGSQGQMRTATLSLKLAELDVVERHNETLPILLLDDVFSELDHNRSAYLLQSIEKAQTIITSNDVEELDALDIPGKVFRVINGKIYESRDV